MKLIKEINDSLKPPDLVQDAIDSVNRVYKAVDQSIKEIREMDDWQAQLEDDQVDMLVDYMKEMIDFAKKRGQEMAPEEAAHMALEDVAGFEGASPTVMKETIARLVRTHLKKTGI